MFLAGLGGKKGVGKIAVEVSVVHTPSTTTLRLTASFIMTTVSHHMRIAEWYIHLFRFHTLSCYNYMADNDTSKQPDPIISSMHNKLTRELKTIKKLRSVKKAKNAMISKLFIFNFLCGVCL